MDDIISISTAKTHLSQLIARVEAGEGITITRGKTPVATWRQSSATANENSGQCGESSVSDRNSSSNSQTTNLICGSSSEYGCCWTRTR